MPSVSITTLFSFSLLASAQEAPTGAAVSPTKDEQKALDGLKGQIKGKIVWSTSRVNSKHDIWIMNADGTDPKAVTNSPGNVDWFPRFSPDGATILFCRSKSGWVPENDAEMNDKWDLWTVKPDGTGEKKVAENAVWGTWRPTGDSIVFARGIKGVYQVSGHQRGKRNIRRRKAIQEKHVGAGTGNVSQRQIPCNHPSRHQPADGNMELCEKGMVYHRRGLRDHLVSGQQIGRADERGTG